MAQEHRSQEHVSLSQVSCAYSHHHWSLSRVWSAHQPFTVGALATSGPQGSQFFIILTRHRDRKLQLSLALLNLIYSASGEKHKLHLLNLDWCIQSNKNDTFLETFGNTINNGVWIRVSYWVNNISRKKKKTPQKCLVMSNSLRPHGLQGPQAPLSSGIFQAKTLRWVGMPSFRGSSQPRDQTQVSCIAGGFFPDGATREAPQSFRTHIVSSMLFYLFGGNLQKSYLGTKGRKLESLCRRS